MASPGSELILHQYETSPFSEKVRKLLAWKGIPWRAVEQPAIMPKPDLIPLTGGYRRIPVLQIGADVYCDSQLIARVLERLHPTPSLYPRGSEGTCHVWNLWADRFLFLAVVPLVFDEIGAFVPKEFIEDRTKMAPGRDFAEIGKLAPPAREQVRAMIATLEAQLAQGQRFLLGDEFSLADAACYHPLWFLRVAPQAAGLTREWPRVAAWLERVEAMGHGEKSALGASAALAIARDATPAAAAPSDPQEPNGIAPGMRVSIVPDDYAFDPVAGVVTHASAHEIAVKRSEPALGEIVVHFPRIGFRIVAEGA
jgi:glutathione S-transferase